MLQYTLLSGNSNRDLNQRPSISSQTHPIDDVQLKQNRKRKFEPETDDSSKLQSRSHSCSKCNVKFNSPEELEVHLRSHPSRKSFRCSTCDKEFTKEENLQLHSKLHLGQKDYVCSICQRSYFTKSGLQAHQKQMHSSNDSSRLDKHIDTHEV